MQKGKFRIFFILLTILLILIRLPSLELPLDPDSGANAFFARQMVAGETLYSRHHPGHHLPGIYYTFVLAFRLFGDHLISPKLLLFPWALSCALLIYYLGRSFYDEQTGVLASIFFVLVSSQQMVTGMTVEMEHFANLPLIGNMLLLSSLLRKRATAWQFIGVGILGVIGILYKVTFVAPLLVAGISMLLAAWMERDDRGVWISMLQRLLWMGAGLFIPLAMVAGYFASVGLWERFTFIFKLGSGYFGNSGQMGGFTMLRPFGFPLFWMGVNNISLLLFGLLATTRLARRSIPLRNTSQLIDVALVLWLIISLALAGLRGGGFAHYVLPVIPPLSLLAAVECSTAYQRLRSSSRRAAILSTGIIITLVVANFLWSNYNLYSSYILYKSGKISHANFHQNVDEDEFVFNEIGDYVRAHTNPDDRIYLWSIHVEVYYYANRMPPIDFLWPVNVSATGPPQRIFDPRTKYIVLDTPEKIERPRWLIEGLAADYELETTLYGREIYRRIQPGDLTQLLNPGVLRDGGDQCPA